MINILLAFYKMRIYNFFYEQKQYYIRTILKLTREKVYSKLVCQPLEIIKYCEKEKRESIDSLFLFRVYFKYTFVKDIMSV